MFKFSRFLITVGLLIPLETIPLETRAVELPELVTQCVDIEGNPCKTAATFQGGFSMEEGIFRRDGGINAANPVKIQCEINVDSEHVGKTADLVVYAHY